MKAKSKRDLKTNRKPGMMSFVCNPSSREGWRKMTDCKVEVKLVYTVSSMLAWLQYQAPPQAKQNIPKTHPISNYSPWLKIKLLAKTYNATTQFITEVMDTCLSSVTIMEPDSFNFSFFFDQEFSKCSGKAKAPKGEDDWITVNQRLSRTGWSWNVSGAVHTSSSSVQTESQPAVCCSVPCSSCLPRPLQRHISLGPLTWHGLLWILLNNSI